MEELELENGNNIRINLIGLNELIKNKESTGRHKDLEAIKFLKTISKRELSN
ncbi:MAG: hypothetical protein KJ799_15020 [Bacteroidetes bacterium]|nr:hypothetical protein [Bacteroidota bacterium]